MRRLKFFRLFRKARRSRSPASMHFHRNFWILIMIGQIQTVKKHDSNVRARFSAQTELKYVVMNDVYRVHEEMGMALTPGKLLASSPRNIYQLVFLKLEKPKAPEKPCSLDCYPDEEKIDSYLTKASNCLDRETSFP